MPQIHRFKVDKLIRDKLPEILRASNIAVCERVMETDEYIKRLQDKLLEEANEVVSAKTRSDIQEELADLLEVIHSLCNIHGLSHQDIEETRLSKKQEKGGFAKKVYNAYVEIDSDNKIIDYYLANPEKYPQQTSL